MSSLGSTYPCDIFARPHLTFSLPSLWISWGQSLCHLYHYLHLIPSRQTFFPLLYHIQPSTLPSYSKRYSIFNYPKCPTMLTSCSNNLSNTFSTLITLFLSHFCPLPIHHPYRSLVLSYHFHFVHLHPSNNYVLQILLPPHPGWLLEYFIWFRSFDFVHLISFPLPSNTSPSTSPVKAVYCYQAPCPSSHLVLSNAFSATVTLFSTVCCFSALPCSFFCLPCHFVYPYHLENYVHHILLHCLNTSFDFRLLWFPFHFYCRSQPSILFMPYPTINSNYQQLQPSLLLPSPSCPM